MNDRPPKRIGILGSTGSIGRQALEVVAAHPGRFAVELLTAGNNADLLIGQALAFRPDCVVIVNETRYSRVNDALAPEGIKVFAGSDALLQVLDIKKPDVLLTAMVGYAGLAPTLAAIDAGIDIALANKETLVVAGDLITKQAARQGVRILPVDSEHSAIFQCLQGEWPNRIDRIILTASGGPFRGMDRTALQAVTPQQALRHPNWSMGDKITIDSSTLMNKGLEMIEARWLFGLRPDQIEVVVHPQSIIHSLVEFEDGSIKAQMGLPDMKLPIQYALAYPERLASPYRRFRFADHPRLTFEAPDTATFPALDLARTAMERGGSMPCILNAANEIAVEAFLQGRLAFTEIPDTIAECMETVACTASPTLEDLETAHRAARAAAETRIAREKIDKFAK